MKNILRKIKQMEKLSNVDFLKYQSKILNGVQLSSVIQKTLTEKLANMCSSENSGIMTPPKLKIILVGDRLDSKVYVENKLKMCKTIGMEGELKTFKSSADKTEILEEIEKSNEDSNIHGIIVQLPLPDDLTQYRTEILSRVDLQKDVDGLNPLNQGKILQMEISDCLIPPTAMGVLEILRLAIDHKNDIDSYLNNYLHEHCFDDRAVDLSGLDVTVLGRGLTAGLPLSTLMQKCNGTVTLCHSKTLNLSEKCQNADIVISAVGKHNLVDKSFIKQDSIVIDVGINVSFDDNGEKIITGDVKFEDLLDKVNYITPVPGGVGKMTVIMLLKNVIKAWSRINKL